MNSSRELKKNSRNISPAKYSIHPEPGRSFFEYKDSNNKLSTFSSSNGSPRIILNPIEEIGFESMNQRHNEASNLTNEVNHYLVSEELCKMSLNNFSFDNRCNKGRHEFPIRYNMSLSNEFSNYNNNHNNQYHQQKMNRRSELSIHDQFVKNKVQNKKRNGTKSTVNMCETEHR